MAKCNQYVYDENKNKVKVDLTTTAEAIEDLGTALDAYKVAFIDPEMATEEYVNTAITDALNSIINGNEVSY